MYFQPELLVGYVNFVGGAKLSTQGHQGRSSTLSSPAGTVFGICCACVMLVHRAGEDAPLISVVLAAAYVWQHADSDRNAFQGRLSSRVNGIHSFGRTQILVILFLSWSLITRHRRLLCLTGRGIWSCLENAA